MTDNAQQLNRQRGYARVGVGARWADVGPSGRYTARKNRKETRKPMDNRRAFALRHSALSQGLGYVFEISK